MPDPTAATGSFRSPPTDETRTVRTGAAPAAPEPDTLPEIPGYELFGKIGRGAYGVVYHARHLRLNRPVAIKLLTAAETHKPEELVRFMAEAEVIAKLRHPGIVQVYEAAEWKPVDGRPAIPFIALEFCPGGTLADQLREGPLSSRPAAHLIADLARAVEHAHRAGVVHRDLKPANILLGEREWGIGNRAEDAASSRLPTLESRFPNSKISDFGLAKASDSGLTATGAIMGTPSYMAPEQASGESVDARSDVYALGAILYECLTGRPPFRGATPLETLKLVLDTDPPSVRFLQPTTPRDLETIAQKCLEKQPAKRYASASELADDLERWSHGEPIHARPAGKIEKAVKWAQRRPSAAMAVAISILFVSVLTVGGLIYNAKLRFKDEQLQRREHDVTRLGADLESERGRVQETQDKADSTLARSNLFLADSIWKTGDALGTITALNQVPPKLRHWEWNYQNRIARGGYATLWGHTDDVTCVTFSRDGTRLASAGDNTIRLWDARNGQLIRTLTGHTKTVRGVDFSPDGTRLASGGDDSTIKIWDARTSELVATLNGHTSPVMCVTFSPDGARVASGSSEPTIKLWDISRRAGDDNPPVTLSGHTSTVSGVTFSPDGARLASGSFDKTIKFWDVRTGELIRTISGHADAVNGVAFSPDGLRLASASDDKTARIWNAQTGEFIGALIGHAQGVNGIAFSPDGAWLASAGTDNAIKFWDVQSGDLVRTLYGHTWAVNCVAFSPDGTRLASGAGDQSVKLWDARSSDFARTFTGHANGALSVAFSPDGARLASGSLDNTIKLWNTRSGELENTLSGHSGGVTCVRFSADGARLASAGNDNTIKLWDLSAQAKVVNPSATLSGHTNHVVSVAFSPDGALLASGSWDSTIKIWNARTGELLRTLPGHTNVVSSVTFSADGSRLASGGGDNLIKWWNVRTGELVNTLGSHTNWVINIALSPNGERLASGSADNTIKLWDVRTGDLLNTLTGHTLWVNSIAFSPDGARVASGSRDWTIKLWDIRTGEIVRALKGHANDVTSVAFSPDGARLASGSMDRNKTITLWDAGQSDIVRTLTGHSDVVDCVAFSPNGAQLASGSRDKTIKLWDTRSGQLIHTLLGHSELITTVIFSSDGTRLASASQDNTIKLWNVTSGTFTTYMVLGNVATNMAFSPDGTRLAGRDERKDITVWDVATTEIVSDPKAPAWFQDHSTRTRSPDGNTYAICHDNGTILLVTPNKPDEFELGYRQSMARFDPAWAQTRADECSAAGHWRAAEFHLTKLRDAGIDSDENKQARGRILCELGRWSDAVTEWYKTVPEDVEEQDWPAIHVMLAANDRAGWEQAIAYQRKKIMGSRPAVMGTALLASDSPHSATATAAAFANEWHANIDALVFQLCYSMNPSDVCGLDACCIGGYTQSAVAIRLGQFADLLKSRSQPDADDFLWMALAELNRKDQRAAREFLDKAEGWLSAPDPESSRRPNASAKEFHWRLKVELLRREVRSKLGLNPDEPVKYRLWYGG